MASIRISLLGGFAAHSPEGDALKLPTRKAEALVAFLACRAGEPQPRDRLAALLWGDRGDQQARHSLSQALSSVRGALDDGSAIFVAEREAVALRPDVADVDVARLQGLGAGSALPDLRRAARLYRGPFLDGFNLREPAFEEWLDAGAGAAASAGARRPAEPGGSPSVGRRLGRRGRDPSRSAGARPSGRRGASPPDPPASRSRLVQFGDPPLSALRGRAQEGARHAPGAVHGDALRRSGEGAGGRPRPNELQSRVRLRRRLPVVGRYPCFACVRAGSS